MNEYECELCGNPTYKKIIRIVEGVKMIVCPNCSDLGESPRQSKRVSNRPYKSNYSNNPARTYGGYEESNIRIKPKKKGYVNKINTPNTRIQTRGPNIEDLELIDKYRDILKKTRSKLNMSQAEFANEIKIALSSYKNIENGKLDLTIKEARRIENKYDIKLTEMASDEEFKLENLDSEGSGEMTLGDVFFKRKSGKYDDED